MQVLTIPGISTFEGNSYSTPLEYVLTDRNISHAGGNILYNEYYNPDTREGEAVSFNKCSADIFQALGFNPFSVTKMYCSNSNDATYDDIHAAILYIMSTLNANVEYYPRNDVNSKFTNLKINGETGSFYYSGYYPPNSISSATEFYAINYTGTYLHITQGYHQVTLRITIGPEHIYDHGEIVTNYATGARDLTITIRYTGDYWTSVVLVNSLQITISNQGTQSNGMRKSWFDNILATGVDDYYSENPNNPYSPTTQSGTGGGDGDYEGADPTTIEKTEVPDVPNISALTTGLLTIYAPTLTQVQSLGDFLWSSQFDIDTFKKLFADPMQAIIGLGIVPIAPTLAGTKTVKIGDVSTGVSMPYVSTQFITKSMGSIAVKKEVGCFMDYLDTKISIYLPYCGMHDLAAEDVMDDTVSVDYNIDIYSGGCTAFVSTTKKGVLYQFSGNCCANVPLTSNNYANAIQNAITGAVGALTGGGMGSVASMAAMGAAGLAANASNTVMLGKPSINRSGNMSGAAGLMGVQKPYLIIVRPRKSVPANLNKFIGYCSNITLNLGSIKGFTMVQNIHLDGINATDDEKNELLSILQEGVIF